MITIEKIRALKKADHEMFVFLKDREPGKWKCVDDKLLVSNDNANLIVYTSGCFVDKQRGISGKGLLDMLRTCRNMNIDSALTYVSSLYQKTNTDYINEEKVFDYFKKQGVDEFTIRKILNEGNIRIKKFYNYLNIEFLNSNSEVTETIGITYHYYKARDSNSSPYVLKKGNQKCYLCSTAPEALSLYLLLHDETASYFSVATIDDLKKFVGEAKREYQKVFLALQKDEAVAVAEEKTFSDLQRLTPVTTCWAEDLRREVLKDA